MFWKYRSSDWWRVRNNEMENIEAIKNIICASVVSFGMGWLVERVRVAFERNVE